MKARLSIFMLLPMLFLSSCEVWIDGLDDSLNRPSLLVHVYGALSGNDRDNIEVSLYYSREDAQDDRNPITNYVYTDRYGEVLFYDLPRGQAVWVKAQALLVKTIRQTSPLQRGENYIEVPIL